MKCMNDLLKCSIPDKNIRVYALHAGMFFQTTCVIIWGYWTQSWMSIVWMVKNGEACLFFKGQYTAYKYLCASGSETSGWTGDNRWLNGEEDSVYGKE